MKNKGFLIIIALTFCFIAFIAGYLTAITTDRSITISDTAEEHQAFTTAVYDHGLLNINIASASDLSQLPGIGDILAQRIITYRENNGPFSNVDDLIHVEGIGAKKLASIKEYITASGG